MKKLIILSTLILLLFNFVQADVNMRPATLTTHDVLYPADTTDVIRFPWDAKNFIFQYVVAPSDTVYVQLQMSTDNSHWTVVDSTGALNKNITNTIIHVSSGTYALTTELCRTMPYSRVVFAGTNTDSIPAFSRINGE